MSNPTEPTDSSFRPKLRPGLAAEPAGGGIVIVDRLRVAQVVQVSLFALEVIRRFDGTRTLQEVQLEMIELAGGALVPLDAITSLAAGLEEALLLDTPRFRERVGGPVRKPACLACYDADPAKLRAQLTNLFTAPGGPGLPDNPRDQPDGSSREKPRAVLVPHMDYVRGNVTYGWGYKELVERTDARVFVIVATSHYSLHRFILTRQHFETPLGVVQTDQAYIDRLEAAYGEGLFEDEHAHIPEHSIELEVVLLQFLLAGKRDFKIVPLLVGSFGDCVDDQKRPMRSDDIARMVSALKKAEAACSEPVCYLISGDLAHIGPKFGDRARVAEAWLSESRAQDEAIGKQLEAADADGYFGVILAEDDRRRICGLPPTYLTLQAAAPRTGRVLHYQQFVHPQGFESVSFAAAAFYE